MQAIPSLAIEISWPKNGRVKRFVAVGWALVGWVLVGAVRAQVGEAPDGASTLPPYGLQVPEGGAAPFGRVEGFVLDAGAEAIDFRTMDIPKAAGQVVLVATVERTFFREQARPSLTARLANGDKTIQRVVSLKLADGPTDPMSLTTFEVRGGGFDGKREAMGRRQPVGQKFALTFAWGEGRIEIRFDGVPRYRGEIDFVPAHFHVQVQSGRAAFESVQFEAERFVDQRSEPARRGRR